MRQIALYAMLLFFLTIILTGCGGAPATPTVTATTLALVQETNTPEVSGTPDPCSGPQLEAEVQKIHRHMREFDDAAILAQNTPIEQLSEPIADLQRIRREAEDEIIPACLTDLKTHQIDHMNTVIETLVAFMGGTDQQTLEQSITTARQQHDEYTLELARLLGLTVVPATAPVINTPEETATP